uniref:Uncharacterized protein n=1 Tax=Babesia bovis TaxID=5865 RepID=S6BFU3_BABBO|nr:conserved hypothetical protein [Babesia bovis]
MLLASNVEPMREFFIRNYLIGIIALVIFLVVSIVISCKRSLAHNKTVAFSLLALMTTCMALYLTCFACKFAPFEITVAAGITAGLTLAVALFAFQTKFDFTGYILYLLIISIALLFSGIIIAIFPSKAGRIAYSSMAALLVCIYLVIDIQMAIGGKQYEWTIDDYVIAAVAIYSDIVSLFLHILSIAGNSNN